MAISGLQVINIGLQNESTGSDSLYTAFGKTKDNFANLFADASPYNTFTGNIGITVNTNSNTNTIDITNTGVLGIIAGTGISVSGSNGNVTIVSTASGGTVTGITVTSNTLTVTGGTITSSGTITVNLPNSISISGNVTGSNLITAGNAIVGGIKTDNYYYANGVSISFAGTYSDSNVSSFLAAYGSNTISTTGNITSGNINVSNGRSNVTGNANTVGGGATVGVSSILAINSAFGSNDANDPASAQSVRGRVTGSNLTKTRNYVTGVTGQYLVTGTNASEFINTGLLGVVGDQTTTANAAVVAYLDGDGGLTTAGSAYGVSMKNSTPGSGFDYGLDLQFIDLNIAGTTAPFKQADIRFNNGVELVANVANIISIGANLTVTGTTSTGVLSLNSSEDLADAAAANLLVTASYFTTVAAETATLAVGTAGQIKTFMMVSSGGNMVITVTNPGWGGSGTMTFSNTGDSCTLQYIASKWFCVGNNGAVFA